MNKTWPDSAVKSRALYKLDVVMPFGKYKGKSIREILKENSSYFFGYEKSDIIKQKTELSAAIRLAICIHRQKHTNNAEIMAWHSPGMGF